MDGNGREVGKGVDSGDNDDNVNSDEAGKRGEEDKEEDKEGKDTGSSYSTPNKYNSQTDENIEPPISPILFEENNETKFSSHYNNLQDHKLHLHPSKCNYTRVWTSNSSNLTLYTPNYPDTYPPGIDCWITVTGLAGYHWLIKFDSTNDLDGPTEFSGCEKDYITLGPAKHYNKDKQSRQSATSINTSMVTINLCSDQSLGEIVSLHENLSIHFHTDLSSTGSLGFKMIAIPIEKCPQVTLYASDSGSRSIFCSGNHAVEYWDESCLLTIYPPSINNINQSSSPSLSPSTTSSNLTPWTFELTFLTLVLDNYHGLDEQNHVKYAQSSYIANESTDQEAFNKRRSTSSESTSYCSKRPHLIIKSNSTLSESVLICEGPKSGPPAISLTGSSVSVSVVTTFASTSPSSTEDNIDPLEIHDHDPIGPEFCFEYSALPYSTFIGSKLLCPHQSTDWYHFDSHCYKLFTDNLVTWSEAEAICSSTSIKGHLVSITDENIQKLIEKLISREEKHDFSSGDSVESDESLSDLSSGKYFYWIGATDAKHENHFQWVDGSAFSFTSK
uniref:C-type lectin domain-containing protein n=1 Tax=Tetranychus urticae TaxID=32264 RepID=T1KIF0_TETUR